MAKATNKPTVSSEQLSRTVPPYQANLWQNLGGPPQKRDFTAYDEMLQVDYQAQNALRFSTNLIIGLIGNYEHPDPALTEFVQQALRNIGGTWSANLRWLLRARVYGFSLAEKVWELSRIAGREAWNYSRLVPICYESVTDRGLVFDSTTGQLQEVVQWRKHGGQGIHIPAGKVVHWPYEDQGDGYGVPLGETMLPLYRAKRSSMEAWQVAAKYRGMPQIVVVVPDEQMRDPKTGLEKSSTEIMADTWAAVQSAGVVVLQGPTGEWDDKGLPRVQALQGAAFGNEFSEHIHWIDAGYLMALGIPALMQLESKLGTRAQSAVHSDAAKLGALPVAEEFAETCLIEQVVKPLLDVNFGEQEDYGSFPVGIPIDEEFVANILTSLNTAGFLGLMVDRRVYQHWQERLPQYLPEIEEQDYYQEGGAEEALPQPTGEPGEEPGPEATQ